MVSQHKARCSVYTGSKPWPSEKLSTESQSSLWSRAPEKSICVLYLLLKVRHMGESVHLPFWPPGFCICSLFFRQCRCD